MAGPDEFIYLGDSMKTLEEAVRLNTQAQLQQTQEMLGKQVKQGQAFGTWYNDENTKYEGYTAKQLIDGLVSGDLKGDERGRRGKISEDTLKSILKSLGDDETIYGRMSPEELVDRIVDEFYLKSYQNLVVNESAHNESQQALSDYTYSTMSSGEEILNYKGEYTDPKAQERALDSLIKTQEGLTIAVEDTQKELEAQGSSLSKNSKLIKAHVIDVRKETEAIDSLNKIIDENFEVLEKSEEGSEDYQIALEKITLAAKEVFGEDITSDFVRENIEKFNALADGGEKAKIAFEELGKAAALKNLEDKLGDAAEAGNYLTKVLTILDGADFDINGTADFTEIYTELANLLLEAGYTADEIDDLLDTLNYTLTWEEVQTGIKVLDNGITVPVYGAKAVVTKNNYKGSDSNRDTNAGRAKSGGGGGSSKDWENPYDKFYNLTESINANLREREKLERQYNKLLREQKHILNTIDYEKNLSDQINNLKQQADKLRREYGLQASMQAGKAQQLQSTMEKYSSLRNYGYYDSTSQQIYINWDAINKVKDEEKGQKIEDYIGKLEELRDAMWDAEDAMLDAQEQIEEMKEDLREKLEELKQAYLNFEDRIVEALVAQRQAEIDELQEVYDLMSESNSSILSAIQDVISEQRALRELEEQKEDIESMQRRLAMLRQDTSGASDLEIMALEEQIADAQQSYTDSLIDQAIDEMGDANERAEEQRQQQIDLLQHQLDWDKENGKFWAQVNELLSTAINPDGSLNNNSPLVELLKSTEGYKAMSEFGKQNWWTNLQKTVAEAMAGLKEWLNPTDVDSVIGPSTGTAIPDGGSFGNTSDSGGSKTPSGNSSSILAEGISVRNLQSLLNKYINAGLTVDGKYGSSTKDAVKKLQRKIGASADGLYGRDTANKFADWIKKTYNLSYNVSVPPPMFKTGGLADFTGPAWLDGTKTHPEIVLNATDSANFMQLRDILRDMNLASDKKASGGDNYFEIHIEVDSLSNDYDVEQVADKVKRIINDDARYRNTNAINLIR